ncbi:hypothetical protein GCM10023149_39230 [Mucilaginibacter gynuensis]|uniref:Uncharacterized protein n=2 Tax=Mucilaginibacter gynuensis TaxID=1302236 RepID=A0ABP8H119_9SPHI
MNKLVNTPLLVLIALITIISNVYAQDSVKRTGVVKPTTSQYVKPAVQQGAKPGTPQTAAKPVYTQQQAQQAPVLNTDRTLNGQYRYLLTKVYNYQQPLVAALYRNMTDTLKIARAELQKAKSTVSSQAATIKGLNADVSTKDETISASNARVDEIRLLGIPFTKATYNLLMWGLVIGFGVALAIVIFTTARFKHEAKYRIKLYDELSSEFQTYKAKANEKEKKLARELQTERNKLDELLGR